MAKGCFEKNSRLFHLVVLFLLIAVALSLQLPYRDVPLAIDSSIFAAVGLHLNHGRVLYRDAWDHKPPVVFFLNAAALSLGGENHRSIRDLQTLFTLLILLSFHALTFLVFRSIGISFLSNLLFLLCFYYPKLYGGGNFTEEYGTFFVLIGMIGVAGWALIARRRGRGWLILAGAGFGTAVLTKEPFVFSAVAWVGYLLFISRDGWRGRAKSLCLFSLGGLIPVVFPLAYFLIHQALGSWIEVVVYGFQYTDRFSTEPFLDKQLEGIFRVSDLIFSRSALISGAFLLGVASLSNSSFLRRTHYLPLFGLYWVILDFFAASLSGLFFLHYYLQMVSPILFLGACGLAFLQRILGRLNPPWKTIGVLAVLVGFAIDFGYPGLLGGRPGIPKKVNDPLLTYLREKREEGDTLWASDGYLAKHYLPTGMLSPTRYLAVFRHHLETGATKEIDRSRVQRIRNDLEKQPPDFILGGRVLMPPIAAPDFVDWLEHQYSMTSVKGDSDFTLIFERVEDPSKALAEQKKEWTSMEAHSPEKLPIHQFKFLKLQQDSARQSF